MVLWLALSAPALAGADPVGVRLDWVRNEGAERCPDGPSLARDVSERLGWDPFASTGERAIEGVVTRDPGAWTARIYLRDRAGALLGTRTLTSASAECASMMGAVTLAVALMVDPEAAVRPRPPTPQRPPRPGPPRPTPAPDAARARPVEVTLGALGAVGLLPGAAPGAFLRVGGPIAGRFGWSFGAVYFPERRTSPDDGFAFGWTGVSAAGCVDVVRGARGALSGCASVAAGGMHAVVYRPAPEVPGDRAWLGLGASARGALALGGPWVLSGELALLVPVTRQRYDVIGRSSPAFEQAAVTAYGAFGVGVSFR